MELFNTPILFIVFNRPDTTQKVFNAIRDIKPRQLFIAADGPREGNLFDAENCRETREIVQKIDWECEVKTLFREKNLGCGKAVSSAITWFFDQVEQGIILEDDCLPSRSFFFFCQQLLDKYKHDPKVYSIGGVNFQGAEKYEDASYYFSAIAHIWGWASWRRAWNNYDFHLRDFYAFVRENKIYNYYPDEELAQHWLESFKLMYRKGIDTWDHQWTFTIMNNGGVSIVPNVNMVSNIGFGADATHTVDSSKFSDNLAFEIESALVHPKQIRINHEADFNYFLNVEQSIRHPSQSTFSGRFKHGIRVAITQLAINLLDQLIFLKVAKRKTGNVLIVKPDNIGDFIVSKALLEYFVAHEKNRGKKFYLLADNKLKSSINDEFRNLFGEIIFVEHGFSSRYRLLFDLYRKMRRLKLSTAIYFVYSRAERFDEVIRRSGAMHRIGFSGDTSNQHIESKKQTDDYYTQLVDVDEQLGTKFSHEFEKAKCFFETLLGEKIPLNAPHIKSETSIAAAQQPVLIFPGASVKERMWGAEKFARLISLLGDKHPSLSFSICTAPGEEHIFTTIQTNTAIQLVHKNNLDYNGLVSAISQARLVIGSDSAPAHYCAALKKQYVCLSNANHFRRFMPYPEYMNVPQQMVYPKIVRNIIEKNPDKLWKLYGNSNISVNRVEVQDVLQAVEKLIGSQQHS